jgi:hypothetical protein
MKKKLKRPLTALVVCMGKMHRIRMAVNGQIALLDHTDEDKDHVETLGAIANVKCVCREKFKKWIRNCQGSGVLTKHATFPRSMEWTTAEKDANRRAHKRMNHTCVATERDSAKTSDYYTIKTGEAIREAMRKCCGNMKKDPIIAYGEPRMELFEDPKIGKQLIVYVRSPGHWYWRVNRRQLSCISSRDESYYWEKADYFILDATYEPEPWIKAARFNDGQVEHWEGRARRCQEANRWLIGELEKRPLKNI